MNDLHKAITLKSHTHTHTHTTTTTTTTTATTTTTTITTATNFRVYAQKVEKKKKTKRVGVLVDEYLTFKAHIESVKWKLAKASGILAKIKALCFN